MADNVKKHDRYCRLAVMAGHRNACHIMFMPCRNRIEYEQRFERLDKYIGRHHWELTSGLYDVDVFYEREAYMRPKVRREPHTRTELPYHEGHQRKRNYHRE